jgi:hypothetical protein
MLASPCNAKTAGVLAILTLQRNLALVLPAVGSVVASTPTMSHVLLPTAALTVNNPLTLPAPLNVPK